MKTKITFTALLVLAGLLSSTNRANAAIVELDLNDTSIYNNYSEFIVPGTAFRNIELSFRFTTIGFVTNLDYRTAISIKSLYFSDGYIINSTSEVEASDGNRTAAVVVAAGQIIHLGTSGWTTDRLGYLYTFDDLNGDGSQNYGLSVSASPQYIGLFSDGYVGYASLSIPNTDGKMYINKVAFSNIQGQGIIAGGGVIPEPSTYGLIAMAALGVAFTARRRKVKKAV